jgi:two-component system, NarL family, sensor histidine kinase UhpB
MEHGFSLSSRVILINALLFALAVLALALSPATVSSPPVDSEVLILLVGLAVVIGANAVLVRAAQERSPHR